jgi:hypothetical protein
VIDLSKNNAFALLEPIAPDAVASDIAALLVPDERIVLCFRTIRDSIVFTDKRVITMDVQGFGGKRRDFSSFPYSRVQAFSVGTAKELNVGADLELWFSGLGKVSMSFKGRYDVVPLGQMISTYVL